ncbi:hypothetical protein OU798_14245 [Prolixibacteraceae bacterium Z1-6]|uniref:Uncharacterized protein n=1 Tax=Draconibacterium aestuarii TaxID=2998507 RepID=A0A9X3J708_9BACT|nr:hypothetical protein [Prolixibacteraceae bacterium Z1-6]
MLIDNKISKLLYGPYNFIGLVFALVTINAFANQNWIMGTFFLFVTWFLFTGQSGIDIDTEKNLFRRYNKYFGLFKTGKWESTNRFLGLTLVPMKTVYRMYSRSNRINTSAQKEFHIYFVGKNKRPAIAIKRCKTYDEAQNKMDELAIWLHLPVFSV